MELGVRANAVWRGSARLADRATADAAVSVASAASCECRGTREKRTISFSRAGNPPRLSAVCSLFTDDTSGILLLLLCSCSSRSYPNSASTESYRDESSAARRRISLRSANPAGAHTRDRLSNVFMRLRVCLVRLTATVWERHAWWWAPASSEAESGRRALIALLATVRACEEDLCSSPIQSQSLVSVRWSRG